MASSQSSSPGSDSGGPSWMPRAWVIRLFPAPESVTSRSVALALLREGHYGVEAAFVAGPDVEGGTVGIGDGADNGQA
jgi:hypothetical protein